MPVTHKALKPQVFLSIMKCLLFICHSVLWIICGFMFPWIQFLLYTSDCSSSALSSLSPSLSVPSISLSHWYHLHLHNLCPWCDLPVGPRLSPRHDHYFSPFGSMISLFTLTFSFSSSSFGYIMFPPLCSHPLDIFFYTHLAATSSGSACDLNISLRQAQLKWAKWKCILSKVHLSVGFQVENDHTCCHKTSQVQLRLSQIHWGGCASRFWRKYRSWNDLQHFHNFFMN